MPHHNFHALPAAQTLGQLFRQIHRAMLAAGAAKRHRQALEAATLIIFTLESTSDVTLPRNSMHALLLIQIVDHRRVFAGERLEALFAPGIGKLAGVENEPAAMPALVFQRAAGEMKS